MLPNETLRAVRPVRKENYMASRDYFLEDYMDPSGVGLDDAGQPPPAFNAKARLTRSIHELLGICKGILADGQLDDAEIEFLTHWFQANTEAVSTFPGKEIYSRIHRIYADGLVTPDERDDLKEILARVTGALTGIPQSKSPAPLARSSEGTANASTTLPFDDPEPEVVIPNQFFSFTGKFLSGTRQWCVEQVVKRGARFDPKPTARTNFLVIGALGSRDWAHTSFGRKIEAAMELKPPLKIVSEQHWVDHLNKL